MTTLNIVVARYKEDVSWAYQLVHTHPNVKLFVYDKNGDLPTAIHLPNVGRESHTFLYHIVKEYENIQGVTLFLQGNPFDHNIQLTDLQNLIGNTVQCDQYIPLNRRGMSHTDDNNGHPNHPGLDIGGCWDLIMQGKPRLDRYVFSAGAQYAVNEKAIKNKPFEYWKHLCHLSETLEKFPWCVERLWGYIWEHNGAI